MKKVLKHLLWIIPSILVLAIVSLAVYAASARSADALYHNKLQKTIQVSSKSFQSGQEMPLEFSCRGTSTAPAIQWMNAPDGTRSYTLIAMDWDAPSPRLRLFPIVHWVLYNIPREVNEIPEAATVASLNERKIVAAKNIAGAAEYAPPCPPLGQHQYVFHVYALDVDEIRPA